MSVRSCNEPPPVSVSHPPRRAWLTRALLALSVTLSVTSHAVMSEAQQPQTRAACATPRKAVQQWIDNLQPTRNRPAIATACFDWADSDVPQPDRETSARRLLKVLDVQGLVVDYEGLPDEQVVADGGRVFLFPGIGYDEDGSTQVSDPSTSSHLPELFLVRKDGRWLISGDSIGAIDELYDATIHWDLAGVVERLPDWMKSRVLFGVAWWQVLGLAVLLIVGLLLRTIVAWVVQNWVARFIAKAQQRVGKQFVANLALPVGSLALAAWLGYGIPLLLLTVRTSRVLLIGVRILAAVSAVIVLYRLVDLLSDLFARRAEKTDTKLDDQLVPLLRRAAKSFVVILGGLFVLQNMNVDITSLLAVGTVGTLALSLAAKDTASNFFGSISIFADRPFQVGDWVVVGDVEGVVEEVGMRSTRIRTFKNSLVTMPNSLITVTPVDNFGVRAYRRSTTTLGVRYDTSPAQIEAFCDGIRAILQANPAVRKDAYEVHFTGFGAHSLDVMLYFFFAVDSWSDELRQRHLVYLEILRLAEELKVGFAFPTQTLLLEQVAEAEKVLGPDAPEVAVLRARVASFAPGGDRSRPEGPEVSDGYFPRS